MNTFVFLPLFLALLALPVQAAEPEAKPLEPVAAQSSQLKEGWRRAEQPEAAATAGAYVVDTGTKIPLSLINSISTKHAVAGDRVYLESVFPIVKNGKIVIPPGSYVAGTITEIKRPGKVKGKGELYVRFDSLTLPNGVVRDFTARVGGIDGTAPGKLDREEGKIQGDSDKGGDVAKVAQTTVTGTSLGALIGGASSGRWGQGAGLGAAAGAAAGLIGVLATRGPDIVLTRGTTLEMVLDRDLRYSDEELNFGNSMPRPTVVPAPVQQDSGRSTWPGTNRTPFPF